MATPFERVWFDDPELVLPPDQRSILDTMALQAMKGMCVLVSYRPNQGELGWRTVYPIGLRRRGDSLYVLVRKVGTEDVRSMIRNYALDRILQVLPSTDIYENDPDLIPTIAEWDWEPGLIPAGVMG